MSRAKVNTMDAFVLLNADKSYEDQLYHILINELEAKDVLCISDTTHVLVQEGEPSTSVAHAIEKANLGPMPRVIQSDHPEFKKEFGIPLPQNKNKTRKEYMRVNANTLKEDLEKVGHVDVILGRNCMCACKAGSFSLCGGVGITVAAQEQYLASLIEQKPSLIVLSANSAPFYPPYYELHAGKHQQRWYQDAKNNMQEALIRLNSRADSPYQFYLIDADENLQTLHTDPRVENGYMIVGYDKNKIDFRPSTFSLQSERLHKFKKTSLLKETPDEIIDDLFLGNLSHAKAADPETVVLRCTNTPIESSSETVVLDNTNKYSISKDFVKAFKFIDTALKEGKTILVHCDDGASISLSIVIGYLIVRKGFSYQNALHLVQKKRPCAEIDEGSAAQLILLETMMQLKNYINDRAKGPAYVYGIFSDHSKFRKISAAKELSKIIKTNYTSEALEQLADKNPALKEGKLGKIYEKLLLNAKPDSGKSLTPSREG